MLTETRAHELVEPCLRSGEEVLESCRSTPADPSLALLLSDLYLFITPARLLWLSVNNEYVNCATWDEVDSLTTNRKALRWTMRWSVLTPDMGGGPGVDQGLHAVSKAVARMAGAFHEGERPSMPLPQETTTARIVTIHAEHNAFSAFLLQTEGIGSPDGRTIQRTLCAICGQPAGHADELFLRCEGCYREVAGLAPS